MRSKQILSGKARSVRNSSKVKVKQRQARNLREEEGLRARWRYEISLIVSGHVTQLTVHLDTAGSLHHLSSVRPGSRHTLQ